MCCLLCPQHEPPTHPKAAPALGEGVINVEPFAVGVEPLRLDHVLKGGPHRRGPVGPAHGSSICGVQAWTAAWCLRALVHEPPML